MYRVSPNLLSKLCRLCIKTSRRGGSLPGTHQEGLSSWFPKSPQPPGTLAICVPPPRARRYSPRTSRAKQVFHFRRLPTMEHVPNRPQTKLEVFERLEARRVRGGTARCPQSQRGNSIVSPVLGYSIRGDGPNWGCQYSHQPAPSGPQQNEPS